MFNLKNISIIILFFTITKLIAGPIYDGLQVNNINLDGNTISTTNSGGDLILSPDSDLQLGTFDGFLKASSGIVSGVSSIDPSSDFSSVVPIASGGTNSSTALNNDRVMISQSGAIVESPSVSSTELQYLNNVTSNLQDQLDDKVSISSPGLISAGKTMTALLTLTSGIDVSGTADFDGVTTFNDQYVAISTTNGTRPCPVMTLTQRDAISSPGEGDCIVNSTDAEVNFYLDGEWTLVGGGGGQGGLNFVTDGSFEDEELAFTCTEGLSGSSYPSWTVDDRYYEEGVNELLYSATSNVPGASTDIEFEVSINRTGLDNKPGLASFILYTIDEDMKACIRLDGGTECESGTIISLISGSYEPYEIPFIFGASSVELVIYKENTASSIGFNMDLLKIRPRPVGYIQSINNVDTDWVSYTPTFTGFGTVSTEEFEYKRVGDSIVIRGNFTCGTPTATEAQISLPNSVEVKSGISLSSSGVWFRDDGSSLNFKGGSLLITGGDDFLNFADRRTFSDTNTPPLTPADGNLTCSVSGQSISFTTTQIPIEGWQTGRVDAFSQRQEIEEYEAILSANVTSAGTISDLTISDLSIGKRYRVDFQVAIQTNTDQSIFDIDFVHDSNTIGNFTFSSPSVDGNARLTSSSTAFFTATTNSITFDASSLSSDKIVLGNNTKEETYVTVTEAPLSKEVIGKFDVKQMQQKCQTKFLSSNVTSTTSDITDLKFENLDTNKTYKLSGLCRLRQTGGGSFGSRMNVNDGTDNIVRCRARDGTASGANFWIPINSPSFKPSTSTLTVSSDLASNSSLDGDGTNEQTYLQLCEAPQLIETTEW